MKNKSFIFVLLINVFLSGCADQQKSPEKLSSVLKRLSSNGTFIKWREDSSEHWLRKVSFVNSKLAQDYILERRLNLQRLYEVTAEPYFGKPEEKNCKENINTIGNIIKISGGQFFSLELLSNKNHALGDCLKENNDLNVLYQFYVCGQYVFEYRIYHQFEVALEATQRINCRDDTLL